MLLSAISRYPGRNFTLLNTTGTPASRPPSARQQRVAQHSAHRADHQFQLSRIRRAISEVSGTACVPLPVAESAKGDTTVASVAIIPEGAKLCEIPFSPVRRCCVFQSHPHGLRYVPFVRTSILPNPSSKRGPRMCFGTEASDYRGRSMLHGSPGRFIPHFSTVGVAFSDARNSMRCLDASGFLAPFTTPAANTWTN